MEPYCPQTSLLLNLPSRMVLLWKPVKTREPTLMLLHSHTSQKKSLWKLNSLTSTTQLQKTTKWKWMSMKLEKKSCRLSLQKLALALQWILSIRTGAYLREQLWSRLYLAFWRSPFLIHPSQKASEMVQLTPIALIVLCMTGKLH